MSYRKFQPYLPLLAALLLTMLAYLPGLQGPFVFDDVTNILENHALILHGFAWDQLMHAALSSNSGPLRRPLSMLSFALNIYFGGMNALGFKITNLVIHLANGVLIFTLLRQIVGYWSKTDTIESATAATWLPLLCAAAWLLHPLNLTAVLYVVQRETSLCSFFILSGCLLYSAGRQRMLAGGSGWGWLYGGTLVTGLLAVGCKETGALLPVYLLVIELFVFRFRSHDGGRERKLGAFYGLFLVGPMCFGLLWLKLRHPGDFSYAGRDFTLAERLLTETRVIWDYIRWTLFPRLQDLGLYHDDIPISTGLLTPVTTLIAILGLLALATTALLTAKSRPWVAFGIAWFFAGQLLESTIFPLEIAFEHRNYLADLGILFAVFGFVLTERSRFVRMRYRIGILVLLALTYGSVTTMRAHAWRNPLTLVENQAKNHPHSPYATYALGQELTNLVLAGHKRLLPQALSALKRSAMLPDSGIIASAALTLLESQTTGKNDAANFARMARRLRTDAISSSDQAGLTSLVQCEDVGNCHFQAGTLRSLFDAALANPRLRQAPSTYANLLTDYGNYLSHGHHADLQKSRALMEQAANAVPSESQYRINVVLLDLALRDPVLAERDLKNVKALDHLGNLDPVIAGLKKRIAGLEAKSMPSKKAPNSIIKHGRAALCRRCSGPAAPAARR